MGDNFVAIILHVTMKQSIHSSAAVILHGEYKLLIFYKQTFLFIFIIGTDNSF
jgi:hypothetical protein